MRNKPLVIALIATTLTTATIATRASAGDPALGALLGAGVGAAIGNSVNHHNGAWVGGAIGAVAGASRGELVPVRWRGTGPTTARPRPGHTGTNPVLRADAAYSYYAPRRSSTGRPGHVGIARVRPPGHYPVRSGWGHGETAGTTMDTAWSAGSSGGYRAITIATVTERHWRL
jgi:hypothetical protein